MRRLKIKSQAQNYKSKFKNLNSRLYFPVYRLPNGSQGGQVDSTFFSFPLKLKFCLF